MKKQLPSIQMKTKQILKAVLFSLVVSVSTSWAQTAIFNSSMSISPYGSVNSPGWEAYGNSIDGNVTTKFLDFNPNDGMGFTVNLGGASKIANAIYITTANDFPGRDPKNFEVLGSNDGSSYSSIATGVIECISTRFFTRSYCFENSTAYKYYRVNFTNTCSDNIMQLSEVQLYTSGPGVGGSVSANQSISGAISSTPSGEANLNSGSSAQIMPEINDYQCIGGEYQNCYWDGEQDVCDTWYDPCMYQDNIYIPGHTAAQSFMTSSNVTLSAIKIDVAEVINAGSYYLRIFQGEGDSGTELMGQGVSISNSGTNTFVLNSTLALVGGQSYTFKLESNDGNAKFNWTSSSDSDYSRGSGYTDGNNNYSDFNFQLVYQNNVNWQNVTLTGSIGEIKKWQKSTDSNFSNPIDIASTSATLDSSLIGDVLQTTYFRAVVYGCSTVYSDYVTITVNNVPTTIRPSQCGTTLAAINSAIAVVVHPNVQKYRYKITNGDWNATYETVKTNFSLTKVLGITYNTTYQISVASQRNGVWGDFGPSCPISTPVLTSINFPKPTLRASDCGATLATLRTPIHSKLVYAAQGYRFEVTNNSTSDVYTYDSPIYYFNLSQVTTSATYGTTYSIRIAVKIEGNWGDFGSACNVTTPALSPTIIPTTKVRAEYCGATLAFLASKIPADVIYGAEGYRFEVTKSGTTVEYDSSDYNIRLSQTSLGAVEGATYAIRIAAKINGVYGNYGASCNVFTPSSSSNSKLSNETLTDSRFEVKVYPNPFTTNFKLDFSSSSDSNVEVVVYDMIGRQLEKLRVTSSEMNNLEIGNSYPSGVYNVIVTQGEEVKTLRVIKR